MEPSIDIRMNETEREAEMNTSGDSSRTNSPSAPSLIPRRRSRGSPDASRNTSPSTSGSHSPVQLSPDDQWQLRYHQHQQTGLPQQTKSTVSLFWLHWIYSRLIFKRRTEAKTTSYRHGIVDGSWRTDNIDKEYHKYFPKADSQSGMVSDRVFEDVYSAELEYVVNDNSHERNIYRDLKVRHQVVTRGCVQDMVINCK